MGINRGRIPKLKTILEFIDILADLKYNNFSCIGIISVSRTWLLKECLEKRREEPVKFN